VEPRKAQKELLHFLLPEIVASKQRIRIIVVGSIVNQNYYAECLSEIAGYDSCVEFLGYQSDVSRWYSFMDLLCHPSRREGFGRVIIEAQSMGVPVVALDIPGVRDAVEHPYAGFLCGSHREMALKSLHLLQNPALRAEMGAHGMRCAEQFSAGLATKAVERVYTQLRFANF
jgi:glycosyltransferase involved in cell wall biosynthesis